MRSMVSLSLVALVGCAKAPPEAPKELADLSLFLFQHFSDEDTAELAVGIDNLKPFIKGDDLEGDAKDRAVTLPFLKGESLGDLSIPNGADPEKQIPIGLTSSSPHKLEDHRKTATEVNRVCLESDTTVWARREFLTDTACWNDGSCDQLEAFQETRKENILAKVWYDLNVVARAIEVEDADGDVYNAIVTRGDIEKVFEGDGGSNSWDQLFYVEVILEDGNKSLRWTGYWSSITLGGLGDDAYANLVVSGLETSAGWTDDWIATGSPSDDCNLDVDLAKPDRE